jgi:hypothetical protein
MTTEDLRSEMESLANEQRDMPLRRAELVQRARQDGITWNEIAQIFDMTPHGLIKAAKAAGTFQ